MRAGTIHSGRRRDTRNLPAEAAAHATANPCSLSQHALRAPLGGYRLLEWKLPDYQVPDLKNFEARAERLAQLRARRDPVLQTLTTPRPAQLKPYVSYLTKAPSKTAA